MKFAALSALALLCASGALEAQPRNIHVRLRGHQHAVRLDTAALWNVIPASPARTFTALRYVLDSLNIPVSTVDSANGVIYRSPFNTSRQILGNPMSWALSCGESINGSNANLYRIHMVYALFLEPTATQQTRLGTAFAAGATSNDGTSKAPIRCGSTGAFEREIARRVRARVQAQK